MDVRNIETFIRVAELGSFTKAANELGYVQSAVTMQIQQLEKELGVPLFDRIGKKVSLNELGTEFLEHAYQIIRTMQEALHLGKNIKDVHATLRLGVLESLLFSNMLKLLPKFKEAYKNVNLQIKMDHASELLKQLKENQLDIVYLSAGLNTDPDLCCYYKRREHLVFVSNPRHSAVNKKKISPKELFENDFIVTERSGICYGRLREIAQQHNAQLHTSVEVDSIAAIVGFLKKNNALAFLPEYSVKKELNEGSLSKIDIDLQPQTYYSQILCHKKRWLSPFVLELIEEIKTIYPEME